jgi:hypothetical protein
VSPQPEFHRATSEPRYVNHRSKKPSFVQLAMAAAAREFNTNGFGEMDGRVEVAHAFKGEMGSGAAALSPELPSEKP